MSSLSTRARVAGFLYTVSSAVGFLRLISISNKLIVSGDAAATADNIAAHESLFRWGMFSYLIAGVLFLCVTFALYRCSRASTGAWPLSWSSSAALSPRRSSSWNTVTDAGALMAIRGTGFMAAFEKPQRDALAMLFLELHHHLDVANSVLWGVWLIPFGLLVYRSGFLPRLLVTA
jgi:hypothetical protein